MSNKVTQAAQTGAPESVTRLLAVRGRTNQLVLRGGCAATPAGHSRTTYRNFFPPDARWMFGGIRLAEDLR